MKDSPLSRRAFLRGTLLSTLCLSSGLKAAEPFARKGKPRLLLSLAAYSFRDFMKDTNGRRNKEPDAAKRMDLFQFVDFCAEQGCVGAELTSYYFPSPVTTEFLLQLKRHAFLRGVPISGSAVGNTFTGAPGPERDSQIASVKKWIDYAAIIGAPHIRVFAGNASGSAEQSLARSIEAFEETADYAGRKGIFLGLENHGGIVAEPDAILKIVKAVKSPWFGINLDTGNFQTEDPYRDLARIAPYAVNVQVKADIHPRGQPARDADLSRLVKILRDANYQGFVALEYEGKEDPYEAVPPLLQKLRKAFEA